MKKLFQLLLCLLFSVSVSGQQKSWIRINQLGYLSGATKVAVLVSKEDIHFNGFEICEALTGEVVFRSKEVKAYGAYAPFTSSYRLNFSKFIKAGSYFIKCGEVKSPVFKIAGNIYNGTADLLLNYMRQQRCGYNPFIKDSCHTRDGFIIYHPMLDSTYINVIGGWHDASDYLQYVTTSANAVYQMLFAYQQNPKSFLDKYDKDGNGGANEIPDILDEAKWGLDWLVKMNPRNEMMFNQIADDRDHAGFKLPSLDSVDYGMGKGKERPVYFVTGKPQGVFKYKNRTTGAASTAAKYASAFSLGSELLRKYYAQFSDLLNVKAKEAYEFGLKYPGVCQTAPCKSPYFYEEDNYVDDMELAAMQLYKKEKNKKYLDDAVEYGRKETTTPWMGSDTARHYQWYPFINLGHYLLAKEKLSKKEFTNYLREGIEKVYQRGKTNPFLMGVPFIWCSNNLVAALLTQIRLYEEVSGDKRYAKLEAAMRDWLLGCNPWGTSMIVGLPENGDYPNDPHSAFSAIYKMKINGGLVDGSVYGSIYKRLLGITLHSEDEYAEFQSDYVVYHDDYGDYSTNEPTMDGTASLTYYFSSLQKEGNAVTVEENVEKSFGGIIRGDKAKKEIHLVFTGDEFADGGETILRTLKKHNVKGMFFFTGNFYRNPKFARLINQLKKEGHYLGAHSDKHLLYCSWEKRDSTLVTREEFLNDLKANVLEMKKFGIDNSSNQLFLPAYEWYNSDISKWCEEVGYTLINFSPGTYSNADYTTPDMKNYLSADTIMQRILNYEKKDSDGLNGFLLLTHIGTDSRRVDKFYDKLDELIPILKKRGYKFTLFKK
ncbi:MAG: glycoside hydrolase family 9 protein [Ignavibacteriaceae bacterium]